MTSHVDAEILALSAEGLLDPDEEGSVQEHLAGCDECGEQLNALAAVSRTLGEVPAPPLPADVAARIEDAVQAEVQHRHERPSGPEPPRSDGGSGGGAPLPLHRPKGPKHWMPYLVAAAAAIFVIGGAGAIVQGMFFQDEPVGATYEEAEKDENPDTALAYRPVMLNSDVEYTEEELDTQASEVLGSVSPVALPDALPGAPESDAEERKGSSHPTPSEAPSDVSSCVHKLGSTNGGQQPALIDVGSFQPSGGGAAEDAWVMYYGSEPKDEFDVVVVSPRCAGTGPAEDSVLAETTVAGP